MLPSHEEPAPSSEHSPAQRPQDLSEYIATTYGAVYAHRWHNVGYLACFAVGFQIIHILATRFVLHINR